MIDTEDLLKDSHRNSTLLRDSAYLIRVTADISGYLVIVKQNLPF